jgi:hypothetical protein
MPAFLSTGQVAAIANNAPLGDKEFGEVTERNVSGIIIVVNQPATLDKFTLAVSLDTKDASDVVVPEFPGRLVAEISSIEGGQDVAEVAVEQQDAAVETLERNVLGVCLPLGYLRLRGDDVLRIALTATAAFGASDYALVGYYEEGMVLGEKSLKWRILDADKSVQVPDAAWIGVFRRDISAGLAAEASTLSAAKLNTILRSGNREYSIGGDFAFGSTVARGSIGGQGPKQTVRIWADLESANGVASLAAVMSGTDAASWALVTAQWFGSVTRASKKGVEAAQESADAIRRFELADAGMAKMARYQQRIPKSEALQKVAAVRAPNAPAK